VVVGSFDKLSGRADHLDLTSCCIQLHLPFHSLLTLPSLQLTPSVQRARTFQHTNIDLNSRLPKINFSLRPLEPRTFLSNQSHRPRTFLTTPTHPSPSSHLPPSTIRLSPSSTLLPHTQNASHPPPQPPLPKTLLLLRLRLPTNRRPHPRPPPIHFQKRINGSGYWGICCWSLYVPLSSLDTAISLLLDTAIPLLLDTAISLLSATAITHHCTKTHGMHDEQLRASSGCFVPCACLPR
jgi:hypothetical protein